jgi:cell division initiation protein
MRITPLDIRKQEFHRVMRGLDAEEVYAFLSTIGDEYEALLNDNKALRDRILELDDKVQEYRTMEKTLRDTLLTAERVAVEAKDNARREASLIIKEAQIEVDKSLRDIKSEATRLRQEVQQLRSQRDSYLARMKVIAESHMKFLETAEADFDKDDKALQDQLSEEEPQTAAPQNDQKVSNANLFKPPVGGSTDSLSEDSAEVSVAALADTPTDSDVEAGPVENAGGENDTAAPTPSPSHNSGDASRPSQTSPGATSTLSDINEILERMAEGHQQTTSSANSDVGGPTEMRTPPIPAQTESIPTSTLPNIEPPPRRNDTAEKPEESPVLPRGDGVTGG